MKLIELELIDEEEEGVDCISVVGSPAMKRSFIALSNQNKDYKIKFAEVDKKKHILMGIFMNPDEKIYRFDEETKEEYEVFFSADTIRRVSELYLKNGHQKNSNLEHQKYNKLNGYISESWIVEDLQKDKTAIYNLGAKVGGWAGTMKFESEEEYNKVLENGTGFSIEGVFNEKVILNKVDMEIKDELKTFGDNLLKGIEKILFNKQVKLAQWKSADGTLTLETETDTPAVGGSIMLVTPDGNVPAPIGDYQLEDGSTISVVEVGVIAEIKTAEAPAPVEEMAAPNAMPDVAELKNAISSMLIKFSEGQEARFTAIETKLSLQKQENEDLKIELAATPAVTKTPIAPKVAEVPYEQMTNLQKVKFNREN